MALAVAAAALQLDRERLQQFFVRSCCSDCRVPYHAPPQDRGPHIAAVTAASSPPSCTSSPGPSHSHFLSTRPNRLLAAAESFDCPSASSRRPFFPITGNCRRQASQHISPTAGIAFPYASAAVAPFPASSAVPSPSASFALTSSSASPVVVISTTLAVTPSTTSADIAPSCASATGAPLNPFAATASAPASVAITPSYTPDINCPHASFALVPLPTFPDLNTSHASAALSPPSIPAGIFFSYPSACIAVLRASSVAIAPLRASTFVVKSSPASATTSSVAPFGGTSPPTCVDVVFSYDSGGRAPIQASGVLIAPFPRSNIVATRSHAPTLQIRPLHSVTPALVHGYLKQTTERATSYISFILLSTSGALLSNNSVRTAHASSSAATWSSSASAHCPLHCCVVPSSCAVNGEYIRGCVITPWCIWGLSLTIETLRRRKISSCCSVLTNNYWRQKSSQSLLCGFKATGRGRETCACSRGLPAALADENTEGTKLFMKTYVASATLPVVVKSSSKAAGNKAVPVVAAEAIRAPSVRVGLRVTGCGTARLAAWRRSPTCGGKERSTRLQQARAVSIVVEHKATGGAAETAALVHLPTRKEKKGSPRLRRASPVSISTKHKATECAAETAAGVHSSTWREKEASTRRQQASWYMHCDAVLTLTGVGKVRACCNKSSFYRLQVSRLKQIYLRSFCGMPLLCYHHYQHYLSTEDALPSNSQHLTSSAVSFPTNAFFFKKIVTPAFRFSLLISKAAPAPVRAALACFISSTSSRASLWAARAIATDRVHTKSYYFISSCVYSSLLRANPLDSHCSYKARPFSCAPAANLFSSASSSSCSDCLSSSISSLLKAFVDAHRSLKAYSFYSTSRTALYSLSVSLFSPFSYSSDSLLCCRGSSFPQGLLPLTRTLTSTAVVPGILSHLGLHHFFSPSESRMTPLHARDSEHTGDVRDTFDATRGTLHESGVCCNYGRKKKKIHLSHTLSVRRSNIIPPSSATRPITASPGVRTPRDAGVRRPNAHVSPRGPGVDPVDFAAELKSSFLCYAYSTILSRALPDVRDGLKPVHRRLLFAMNQLQLRSSGGFRKCARVVGEVLGRYHPHGDQAVYDALVRDRNVSEEELAAVVQGPDFPTGGVLVNGDEMPETYATGHGRAIIRGCCHIEEADLSPVAATAACKQHRVGDAEDIHMVDNTHKKQGHQRPVDRSHNRDTVPSLWQVLGDDAAVNSAAAAEEEESRSGVEKLREDWSSLSCHTTPTREMLLAWIDFRLETLRRTLTAQQQQRAARLHLLRGLTHAAQHAEELLLLLRSCHTAADAKYAFVTQAPFHYSPAQADGILHLTLGRLSRLEQRQLLKEINEQEQRVQELDCLLKDDKALRDFLVKELQEIRKAHATPRRTLVKWTPTEARERSRLLQLLHARMQQQSSSSQSPHTHQQPQQQQANQQQQQPQQQQANQQQQQPQQQPVNQQQQQPQQQQANQQQQHHQQQTPQQQQHQHQQQQPQQQQPQQQQPQQQQPQQQKANQQQQHHQQRTRQQQQQQHQQEQPQQQQSHKQQANQQQHHQQTSQQHQQQQPQQQQANQQQHHHQQQEQYNADNLLERQPHLCKMVVVDKSTQGRHNTTVDTASHCMHKAIDEAHSITGKSLVKDSDAATACAPTITSPLGNTPSVGRRCVASFCSSSAAAASESVSKLLQTFRVSTLPERLLRSIV